MSHAMHGYIYTVCIIYRVCMQASCLQALELSDGYIIDSTLETLRCSSWHHYASVHGAP